MPQPITIYVKPHVKKFLTKEYGKEPIYTRADSPLGRILHLAISRDNYLPVDSFDIEDQTFSEDGLVKLKFAISFRISQGKLTHNNLLRLTLALEAEFKKAMHYFCLGRMSLYKSEIDAVQAFLNYFKLPDELINEDTVIKQKQRERKKREVI